MRFEYTKLYLTHFYTTKLSASEPRALKQSGNPTLDKNRDSGAVGKVPAIFLFVIFIFAL